METREIIGIALMVFGLIICIFSGIGALLIIAGIFVFGRNKLALLIMICGIVALFSPTGLGAGILFILIGAALFAKNELYPFGFALTEGSRKKFNPFSGKKHHDRVNDEKFLQQSAGRYYQTINQSQLLDDTEEGQLMKKVSENLISAVESYLTSIGRGDFTQRYNGWDFHLISNNSVNALCMPGGKILVFSGLFSVIQTEEELAFVLGHEMAHSLLDHSKTKVSAQKSKNRLRTGAKIGSIALSLAGYGEAAAVTRVATNVADVGSEWFLMQPWGRDQELEADKLGMVIIHMAGYDIKNTPQFWARMSGGAHTHDFFSTHPTDKKRIDQMNDLVPKILNCEDYKSKPILKLI